MGYIIKDENILSHAINWLIPVWRSILQDIDFLHNIIIIRRTCFMEEGKHFAA